MLIDRLVRFLLPREDHFSALLEELAGKIEEGAAVFAELGTASSADQVGSVANRLKPLETDSDMVCQRMYEAIDRTFVTPIDREDLARESLTRFDRLDLFSNARLEPNAEYYVRVRARTTPRNAAFVWPWGTDVAGLAKFTFLR